MNKIKKWAISIYNWIKSKFTTRYKVTVSFNSVYGDADDRKFIAKKILVQKEKHLKLFSISIIKALFSKIFI